MRIIRDAGVNYVTIAAEMLNIEYGRTLFLDNGDVNSKPAKYPIFVMDGAEIQPRTKTSNIYIGTSLSINKFAKQLVETICELTDKAPKETYETISYLNDSGLFKFTTKSQGVTAVGAINMLASLRILQSIRRIILMEDCVSRTKKIEAYTWNIEYLSSPSFNYIKTYQLAAIVYDCDNAINAPESRALLDIPDFYPVVQHNYRFSTWDFPELELYYGTEQQIWDTYFGHLPNGTIVYKVPIAELAQIDVNKVTYSDLHGPARIACPKICEMCERELRGDYYILEKKVVASCYLTPLCVYCAHSVSNVRALFADRTVYRVVVDYDPSQVDHYVIGLCKEMRDDNLRQAIVLNYRGEKINVLLTPNYCYLPHWVSAKTVMPAILRHIAGPNGDIASVVAPMVFMQKKDR